MAFGTLTVLVGSRLHAPTTHMCKFEELVENVLQRWKLSDHMHTYTS